QQHHARDLEEEDVVRIEHAPDGLGIGDAFRHPGGVQARRLVGDGPAADDHDELDQHDQPDQRTDRQILQEAFAQLGEIAVEHHDDEEEQARDRADIDNDQDHG